MRNILNITRNDLRIIFADNAVWFNIIIFPALFIVVVGLATGVFVQTRQRSSRVVIDVLDLDGSALSQQFAGDLQAANAEFIICPFHNDCELDASTFSIERAEGRLEANTSQATIEIPLNFEHAVLQGNSTTIVYRSPPSDPTTIDAVFFATQEVLERLTGAATASRVAIMAVKASDLLQFQDEADGVNFQNTVYQHASELWDSRPGRVTYHETARQGVDFAEIIEQNTFSQSMPGMGIYAVMVNVGLGLITIIDERKRRTLQRLIVMPVRRSEILAGKLFTRFLLGMMAFTIAVAIGAILGVNFHGQWFAVLLLMFSFTLCITALTFLFAALLRTEETARSISSFLTILLAMLGGALLPMEIFPAWLRTVGHISPVAWAMDGFMSLIFYGGALNSVIVPVIVLLLMSGLFFSIAVWRFRYE